MHPSGGEGLICGPWSLHGQEPAGPSQGQERGEVACHGEAPHGRLGHTQGPSLEPDTSQALRNILRIGG